MLNDSEIARRVGSKIEVRTVGMRIQWKLDALTCSDGHTAEGSFSCIVRGLPDTNEQKMLEEALLGSRSVVTFTDVADYFRGAIESSARNFARGIEAESILSEQYRTALGKTVMDAAKAVAFGCGLELLPPVQIDLESASLRQQKAEILQRQAAERRAADQAQQINRSAELFRQFESIRKSAPELSPSEILQQIGIPDRAELLRSLLLASAQNSQRQQLWAVAGPYLIKIDRAAASPRAELIPVPATLGPLRSVQSDGAGGLLIGCRSGVMRLDPNRPDFAAIYPDQEVTSQLGFNAAVLANDRIWGAHGEAGLVCWKLDQTSAPAVAIRPKDASVANFSPRNLAISDRGRPIFSSGGKLLTLNESNEAKTIDEISSAIVAVIARDRSIATIHENGMVCTRENADAEVCRQQRTGKVSTAASLPWLEDQRVLLATEDGPILCAGFDDELITQYASPYLSLRIVVGAADTVAAVTSDRQRIVLWHSWAGNKPFAEIHLAGIARHRVADLAFA
jgi:hypothetical protein